MVSLELLMLSGVLTTSPNRKTTAFADVSVTSEDLAKDEPILVTEPVRIFVPIGKVMVRTEEDCTVSGKATVTSHMTSSPTATLAPRVSTNDVVLSAMLTTGSATIAVEVVVKAG